MSCKSANSREELIPILCGEQNSLSLENLFTLCLSHTVHCTVCGEVCALYSMQQIVNVQCKVMIE